MTIKRVLAAVVTTAGLSAGLVAVAGPASADPTISCYEVGFDHLPGAYASTNPPRVVIDDGGPYVRQYPCL